MNEPKPTTQDSPSATASPYTARIDAQLLYWSRLAPTATALDAQQQRFRFERVLPVSVESLHVVVTALPDGGSLLVGIEPERLRAHLAQRPDVTATTWALVPDRIPDHLGADTTEPATLNLLQGDFEPERHRTARRIRTYLTGIGLAAILVAALTGIERRVTVQGRSAETLRYKGQELLLQAMGPPTGPIPPAALLVQELRRLEQMAQGSSAVPVDAGEVLQRLWRTWPTDVRAQVETVMLAPDRLTLRGSVPTLADAERIAKACPTIPAGETSFQAAPLQVEQTPQGAAFLLSWTRQASAAKGGRP